MSTSATRSVAFFDLDRTLIDCNSALVYARYELRHGRIRPWQFAKASVWMVGYHLSTINMESAYHEALAHYRGASADEIDQRTRGWFHDEIAPRLLLRAYEAMARHRDAGHPVVLLSNTSQFQARVATEAWQLDDWLANTFEIDETGSLTGRLAPPMCYGAGKVDHAAKWLADHGYAASDAYFYTDSYSDLPGLLAVGHPRVVNADPRLAREAKRRGWQTENWVAAGYAPRGSVGGT